MQVSDNDLELLETYLDGAIDPAQSTSLQIRLTVEPQLNAALDELRAERSMRQAVWRAMEPDQLSADRLTWRIQGAVASQQSPPRRGWGGWGQWDFARTGTAAAACLLLGFLVGRIGHPAQLNTPAAMQGQSSLALNSSPTTPANSVLMVPVTDEYGRVVAMQPFGNANDAKAFTEDLHRARGVDAGAPADVRLSSFEKF